METLPKQNTSPKFCGYYLDCHVYMFFEYDDQIYQYVSAANIKYSSMVVVLYSS